jgi:hypothetical protein
MPFQLDSKWPPVLQCPAVRVSVTLGSKANIDRTASIFTNMHKSVVFLVCSCIPIFFLASPRARALDDIGPTNRVWLQGVGDVETSNGFQIDGTLRLETIDDAYNITLVVNGVVTNSPSGLVEINPGAGGGRMISADWINEGLFKVNYSMDLSRSNGFFLQRGIFVIADNQDVFMHDSNGFFNQEQGVLTINGRMELEEAAFNYNGGTITGEPTLINSVLFIAPAVTNHVSFTFNGPYSRLASDLQPGQSIRSQGTLRDGPSILASPTGFQNAGTILLDSTNFPARASLIATPGAITNLASGVIDVLSGAGGEREIDADLINLGQIRIGADCRIAPTSGGFTNEGQVSIGADQTLIVQSNYRQGAAASLAIGLSQPEIGFPHESIEISGTAQLDGHLQIVLPEGVRPAPLDEFTLLRSKARSGYFSSALLPPLSAGMFWNIDYTTNRVTLSLTDSFTAPALKPSLLPDGHIRLLLAGSAGGGYILQTSTNLLDWSGLRTNQPFAGVFEFVETNVTQTPHRFYRVIPAH